MRTRTVVVLLATVTAAVTAAAAGRADAADPNAAWASLASASPASPLTPSGSDLTRRWTAPDGRAVTLVVAAPHPTGSLIETVPASAASGDATPVFAAAIAAARANGAAVLSIPQGTYTFESLDRSSLGHLVLSGLTDMTIEGNGATLVFDNDATGIAVTTSHRVLIRDLDVTYGFNTVSVGVMRSVNGSPALVITHATYPITAADAVGAIAEIDPTDDGFVPNGTRLYQPSSVTLSAPDTYTSTSFRAAMIGQTFAVYHHYYGGIAVEIEDTPANGVSQSADITLDDVNVQSGPGMGIVGYGYARGFAVINSSVAPAEGAWFSTEYDGIHLVLGGGDTIVDDNVVSGTGDDAINAAAPVLSIVSLDPSGTVLTLGPYSRFVMPGDTLAVFDANGNPVTTATVQAVTTRSYPNSVVTLASSIGGVGSTDVVRDASDANDRLSISGNVIDGCECHAILLQTPNALVRGNTISNTASGGIEALSNIGNFLEGAGAINDIIDDNTLSATGDDPSLSMPWGAISLYGATNGGVETTPINFDVAVTNNTISDPTGTGCITVASASTVAVTGNACTGIGASEDANSQGIAVLDSDGVTVSGNTAGPD